MDNNDLADNNIDLARLRRYERWEVAEMLNISPYWLRDWVAAKAIPHQRKGEVRGVWFSSDDIEEIGRMLPSLMSNRQANTRAETRRETRPENAESIQIGGTQVSEAAADDLAERFVDLRSLRAGS